MDILKALCDGSAVARRLIEMIPGKESEAIALSLKKIGNEGFDFYATGARASLCLWLAPCLGLFKIPFSVSRRRIIDQETERGDGKGIDYACEATMIISAGEKKENFVHDGTGPVNALELCLRKGLVSLFPKVEAIPKIKLIDYAVTDLNKAAGSAAKTRAEIVFSDGEIEWKTIGCNRNVIAASFQALKDGYCYPFLLKELGI